MFFRVVHDQILGIFDARIFSTIGKFYSVYVFDCLVL